MEIVQTIYCDDAGFTGNHLLDIDQPAFVYASVAIDPEQATALRTELISRFRIAGQEMKGARLVGHQRGRDAIAWLLNECKEKSRISVSNKKYALACKFFEYVFEPVLATNNSLFYSIGFHKFIATLMYVLFESNFAHAEEILEEFESFMRTKNLSHLDRLLAPLDKDISLSDPLGQILTFALCHRNDIADEVEKLKRVESVSKWALELTTTSLFWQLSYWGERYECIDVYCDQSKPLAADMQYFDAMIGRRDKIYLKFGSHPEAALTFNLKGPITLVDSRKSHGVQIADVLASSISHALRYPDEDHSKEWLALANDMISGESIVPDSRMLDLSQREPFVNGLVLRELVNRSVKGSSVFSRMPEFIEAANYAYYQRAIIGESTG